MKKIAAIFLGLSLALSATSAHAALSKCTSSQVFSINSQTSVVKSYQISVTAEQNTYNARSLTLKNALAKVADLQSKITASQIKIAGYLANVAKNLNSSPSIARGYQANADSETRNLATLQSNFKWANSDLASASKNAASSQESLNRAQASLATQQKSLDALKAKCAL
jgi:chromosome segregation ATPase